MSKNHQQDMAATEAAMEALLYKMQMLHSRIEV